MSFLKALHNKYASENSKSTTVNAQSKKPLEISGKIVEEVGFEKIREQLARLYELQIVLLDGLCVAGVLSDATVQQAVRWREELGRIAETCPKITELDLSRNCIESWVEVEGVCTALPKLKSLKIKYVYEGSFVHTDVGLLDNGSGNRLREESLVKEVGSRDGSSASPYQGITELGLDNTLLCWEDVSPSSYL